MRHFRNFLYFCLGVMLILTTSLAFAVDPAWNSGYGTFTTPQAAAADKCSKQYGSTWGGGIQYSGASQPVEGNNSYFISCTWTDGSWHGVGNIIGNMPYVNCPSGQTQDQNGVCQCPSGQIKDANGQCACPDGLVLQGGQCINPCPSSGTKFGSSTSEYITSSNTTNVCISGCQMTASGSLARCSVVNGQTVCNAYRAFGPFTTTGSTCTGSNQAASGDAPKVEPSPCPAGTSRTGTDSAGMPICTGSGTPPTKQEQTKQPTQTTNNPDGSTTTTDVTTTKNSDGSTTTTTTTTTTKADGTKQTSTSSVTSNTPSGVPGRADGDPQQQNDFCRQNPQLNICKNSNVSGSCENIACEGDAITCAILRQQAKEYCENKAESTQSQAGQAIISGNDPLAATFPKASNAQTFVTASSLDQSSFLSSSCLSDKTTTFRGQQITIEFSKVCDYLLPFRAAIMVVAGLFSLKLISKPILG